MRGPRLDLFLISFLVLFFELAAIRWFGSTVVFLTFFTNIVLLACFLGTSVGLLSAARGRDWVVATLPLTLISMALALITYMLYASAPDQVTVAVGEQRASPQLVYFGTEYRPADPGRWIVPVWAVGGVFFVLLALVFVGLGQAMGRAFAAIPDRVAAYTTDIIGSLTGIAAFAAVSYLELPPYCWFLPVVLLVLYFSRRRDAVQIASAAATLVLAGISAVSAYGEFASADVHWSPYYKIVHVPQEGTISTNNIGHQQMVDVREWGPAYSMPHLLVRDAGAAPFEDVLIVGAGSGNDVAAALRGGARRVDAVEIDPRIHRIGVEAHPLKPYADPRVSVMFDDGRSVIRNAGRHYDLVVYALVDSLVLHSGYSSLRLENFLFTAEAFAEARRRLKPGGVFVMYNYYRQGWVVARLAQLAREAFGSEVLTFSLPYQEEIVPGEPQGDHINILLAGAASGRLEAVRARFAAGDSFWAHPVPVRNEALDAFSAAPPDADPGWQRIAPARVRTDGAGPLPEDDWPQLYLRERKIPWAPLGQGLTVMAVLSLAILLAFVPLRGAQPNGQMFFLGAGFMLLETKGVVHMALLFGSTWLVNTVVFGAILVMVLCANLYVTLARPRNLLPFYLLLLAALLANALVPMGTYLSLPPLARTVASCAVVFVPVFFAGVIFAAVFRDSRRPADDLGSNIAGIILGGLTEPLSLMIGFNNLLLVAGAYYLLSYGFGQRRAGT